MSHLEKASTEIGANHPSVAYGAPQQPQYYRKLGNPGPLYVFECCETDDGSS